MGFVHAGQFAEPALAPPVSPHEQELQAEGKEYQEKSIYLRANPPLEPEAAEAASFEQALTNGTVMGNPGYLPLVNEENAPGHPFGGGFKIPHNLGLEFTLLATPDLSHVVFKSWKAAPGVYEWGPGEHIQLVSLLPEAGAVSCTAATCKPRAPEEVEPGGYEGRPLRNAISDDGSRIFLTAGNPGRLYVRDTATQETLQLDVVQGCHGTRQPEAEVRSGERGRFEGVLHRLAAAHAGLEGEQIGTRPVRRRTQRRTEPRKPPDREARRSDTRRQRRRKRGRPLA